MENKISLKAAKKYNVTLQTLIEWARNDDYPLESPIYSHTIHAPAGLYGKTCCDIAVFDSPSENGEITESGKGAVAVEIVEINCPTCGPVAAYGWTEGGYHATNCGCGWDSDG